MTIDIPTLDFAAVIPVLTIVITGILVLLFDLFVEEKRALGILALVGVVVAIVFTAILWPGSGRNFQSMLVADGYALLFDFAFLITAGLGLLVSIDYLSAKGLQQGSYYALLLFATSGMMVMAAATDLIIIFLGLEIMSVSLYILVGFNRRQMASVEAALKYFILGSFAAAFFLYGVALTYGAAGSTNLSQIGAWLAANGVLTDALALAGLSLLLVGFAFKVAAVPFQWWTPDVYQGAPTSVTAFMSVGAKLAGFAALVRLLQAAFNPTYSESWMLVLAILAALTMTGGNLAALLQKDVKRMLAYSSIAHAGYILVGIAAANASGVRGVLFYAVAYTFMTVGAFAIACVVERREDFSSRLEAFAGLSRYRPWLAAAMAVFMFSLTGIPPLVGFWGKLFVFRAAVEANMSWLAILGVVNSAISTYYYLGVVVQMYMQPAQPASEAKEAAPEETAAPPRNAALYVSVLVAGVATVVLGLWPGVIANLVASLPIK